LILPLNPQLWGLLFPFIYRESAIAQFKITNYNIKYYYGSR